MRTEVGRAQQLFGTASSVAGALGAATPALAGASAHAKDILLADHIANQAAGKQRNRALYGAASSALSVAGSGLLAGATHGGSVAASGALQAAGTR